MMKPENAIEVRNITKKFKIYHDKGHMLKERALHWSRNRYEVRNVLNGISFDVRKGEAIGLVGHNGCGKSTTLKLLTRIMYPDSGTIELCGRVSSLLELGAGFHPDMSGRENIYINASIFGLTKREIDKRVSEIIEFSELEDFIDNPVRTYSSGMYMRLAFSVAINVDADILLIDEILGVGDTNFQLKCFDKLMEIKKKGTTIVIVSHALEQIELICERSIWIHEGLIKAEGAPKDVHRQYLDYMAEQRNKRSGSHVAGVRQTDELVVPEGSLALYRLYNPNTGGYFWTGSNDEKQMLVNAGWIFEGLGWISPMDGERPVFRLYDEKKGYHHYTMDVAEKDALVSRGWRCEGIAWNSADPQTGKPVFRLCNLNTDPGIESGIHIFTASEEEKNNLVESGWKYEGIGWYAQ